MIDDLLLQEVFSLRQKVLILAELLAKHEPELCTSGLLHDIGTEDYQNYRISTKNTEQQVQPDKSTKCVFPDNYIICGAYDGNGNCKSPKGTCRLTKC